MTIGTFTLFALTGTAFSLKLAIMALAVVLLTKTLSPIRIPFARLAASDRLRPRIDSSLWTATRRSEVRRRDCDQVTART